MWYTYVLHDNKNDRMYIGFTNNLEKRLLEHKRSGVYTTKKMSECELVYYETCKNKKDAQNRERQLKTGFGRGYLRRRLENYLKKS